MFLSCLISILSFYYVFADFLTLTTKIFEITYLNNFETLFSLISYTKTICSIPSPASLYFSPV